MCAEDFDRTHEPLLNARPATRRGVLIAATMAALLLQACAVSEVNPQVFSDYDPGTNFAGYRTFAWKSADPLVVSSTRPVTPEGRKLLMAQTITHLEAKGLHQVDMDANPDLLISIIVGSRDDLTLNNFPSRWGGSYVELRETPTGGVGVELFQAGTEQRLWTGWATTGLTAEFYANRKEIVEELISLVLAQFPPDR
jgi:hypothetical protein